MTATRAFLLSIGSALLLSLAWFWHLGILIFFAFVPLLVLEHYLTRPSNKASAIKRFAWFYLCFLTWNVLVTWWIVYASFEGALMAFIFNSLLMTWVFMIFSFLKNKINKPYAMWLLIPVWLAWEHIHTLWDITWTWLTLGNVFAFHHHWVQWYEFTGTSGGSFWILGVNLLVFGALMSGDKIKLRSPAIIKMALAIILPMLLSRVILALRTPADNATQVNTLIVQPNIDPYSEKFYVAYLEQFNKVLTQIRGKLNYETDYLVLPETFITGISNDLNEEEINDCPEIKLFRDSLIEKFPKLRIICGANTYKFYYKPSDFTSTSRKDTRSDYEYDVFNTALYINSNTCEVYHKSKLVPGVEKMPFPALFRPLEKLAINMGGTMGSLGIQAERSVFRDKDMSLSIAPVICYESVYADYLTEYMRKGAGLIFIITNDGWWKDTPGYKQHLNYARLRAIENRRQIARSANTGTSCFIDEFGNIHQATNWWEPAVISQKQNVHTDLSFFAKFGDLLSYFSLGFTSLLIIWVLMRGILRK